MRRRRSTGSATLTERMIFAHACVEARSAPDRDVFIEDETGARMVTARTDRHGRALVPLREVVRQRLRPDKSSISAVVRVDGEPKTYRFQVLVPRIHHPAKSAADGRLVLKVVLDKRDLPEHPALACFDILQPFDAPAVVNCALTAVGPQRYEATVDGHLLPTSRGRWIVFLVDAARSPARGMSGGVLVDILLGSNQPLLERSPRLRWGCGQRMRARCSEALEDMPRSWPCSRCGSVDLSMRAGRVRPSDSSGSTCSISSRAARPDTARRSGRPSAARALRVARPLPG